MQPYVHALTSAKIGKRDWMDDLPIHEFMDIAKHACPDLRHRVVLHNVDLGPTLAAMAFPCHPAAREVAVLHVRQDLKALPTLADWLQHANPARLPRIGADADTGHTIVREASEYLRLADDAPVQAIWDFLSMPSRLVPAIGTPANAILMNSVGPILARAIFGPAHRVSKKGGGETMFDPSWVCEGIIVAAARHIPTLDQILTQFDAGHP